MNFSELLFFTGLLRQSRGRVDAGTIDIGTLLGCVSDRSKTVRLMRTCVCRSCRCACVCFRMCCISSACVMQPFGGSENLAGFSLRGELGRPPAPAIAIVWRRARAVGNKSCSHTERLITAHCCIARIAPCSHVACGLLSLYETIPRFELELYFEGLYLKIPEVVGIPWDLTGLAQVYSPSQLLVGFVESRRPQQVDM